MQLAKVFVTCKNFIFKVNHPNVNIRFSKFCALRPKCCFLTGSKMTYSACVCSAHQNVVLLVDEMDEELTYKDLIKLTLSGLFAITFISPSFTKAFFFNYNISSSPYLEMLLIRLTKLLLFFLSVRNVRCCVL